MFGKKKNPASRRRRNTFVLEPILTPLAVIPADLEDASIEADFIPVPESIDVPLLELPDPSSFAYDGGVFVVGESGEVGIDFLFDGGVYDRGEVGIFSLDGLEGLDPDEFAQAAAQRALSGTEGHVVIADATDGARFSGKGWREIDFNAGDYQGVQTFKMEAGTEFGIMLVPNQSIQEVADGTAWHTPLFSMASENPDDALHFGQIADVTGDGNTFVMEDVTLENSDQDYNDIVFQIRGATAVNDIPELEEVVAEGRDWREGDLGKSLVHYADAYTNGTEYTASDFAAVQEHQPLVGIIDTGFAGDNPDIDYGNIITGSDFIDGDDNPFIDAGEGNEHGTHVLGIIAAQQDNGIGIDGINDDAPVWLGRAVGSGRWADSLIEFIHEVRETEQPNAVLNLSLDLTQVDADGNITTRYELTPEERSALDLARQHDILLVVSSGNDNGAMSALGQASQEFDNIITVGAADGADRAAYSSYGYGLDILAEGGTVDNAVTSTMADGAGKMAGSSVAAAKVTGAVSQVWAANPDLNYRQVIDLIKNTATDLGEENWDVETGSGLLNMAAAVHLAKATKGKEYYAPATAIPVSWSGEGQYTPAERAVHNGPPGTRPYTFKPGDTLSELAEKEWGNWQLWTTIVRADGSSYTPDEAKQIPVGEVVYIPDPNYNPAPNPDPNPNPDPDPAPNPNPNPQPAPIPNVPINANSPNYTHGPTNPFAYQWIGQCTWFAYGRAQETGLMPSAAISNALFRSHAYKWKADAERIGLPVTSTPTPGARGFVVWPPGVQGGHSSFGHVAFLEEVYPDGRVRISEANWGGKGISERILSPAQYSGLNFVRLENAQTNSYTAQPGTPGQSRQYVIQPGDTLWAIAQRFLGDGNRWREIMKTPTGGTFTSQEARRLQIGQSVYLPVSGGTGNGGYNSHPTNTVSVAGMRPYVFGQLGSVDDTLWEIAERELGSGFRWGEIRKADGTTYTSEEARRIPAGTIVYLPTGNEPTPVDPNPEEQPGNGNVNTPETQKSTSNTLVFSLEDQSLWGLGTVDNPSLNVSDTLALNTGIGIGDISAGINYKLEAFLSPGTFDSSFPAIFDIDYPESVEAGSTIDITFSSKLGSDVNLNTEMGASFVASGNAFAKLQAELFGYEFSPSIELGAKISPESLLSLANSPVGVDVSLAGTTDKLEDGNVLKTEDKAFQYIDIANALAAAASIAAGYTGVGATLIPKIQQFAKALKNAGIGAKIGGNIKQESFMEIQGFEVDFDNQRNGNEIFVGLNETSTITIPTEGLSLGKQTFSPIVRPVVDFWSNFSLGGQAEGSFEITKVGSSLVEKLPEWAKKPVEEVLPKIELKGSIETPYTPDWSPAGKFNPFDVVNINEQLPGIDIEIR